MMINKTINFSLIFILISTINLFADLTWSKESGWTVEGTSILDTFMSKNVHIQTALQAMNCARDSQEACDFKSAKAYYKQVYRCYPDSILAPEALYQTGIILIDERNYSEAFRYFERIITDYPSYPKFNDVIQTQFEIASLLQRGKRPYYWGIIPGFRNYDTAVEYFESIILNAPYSYYAPMALMNIADLAENKKKYEDVIDALERITCDYPESSLAPDAYLRLAKTHACLVQGPDYDQGATLEAINYYEDFLILFPDDSRVHIAEKGLEAARETYAKSKLKVGDFYYYNRNNPEGSVIFYNEAISIAPKSISSRVATNRLERINQGCLAPKCFVDMVFGRYSPPCLPAYLNETIVADRETKVFTPATHEFLEELQEERDCASCGPCEFEEEEDLIFTDEPDTCPHVCPLEDGSETVIPDPSATQTNFGPLKYF